MNISKSNMNVMSITTGMLCLKASVRRRQKITITEGVLVEDLDPLPDQDLRAGIAGRIMTTEKRGVRVNDQWIVNSGINGDV